MLKHILSAGTEIVVLEEDGIKVAMPKNSLTEHLTKHPEIAETEEDYLDTAMEILQHGTPYKNGLMYHRLFLSGYRSTEVDSYLVLTVHKK